MRCHLKILCLFYLLSPFLVLHPWFLSKFAGGNSQGHDNRLSYKFTLFHLCLNSNLMLEVSTLGSVQDLCNQASHMPTHASVVSLT